MATAVSRKPMYSVKLPAMANCEQCSWFREGLDVQKVRRLAGAHFVETTHRIRMDQTRTTVWDRPDADDD